MASGRNHDRAGIVVGTIASALYFTTPLPIVPFVIGNVAGCSFLSPDIDTRSRPYYNWGWAKIIWHPLQKMTKHRGVTHVPILGAFVVQAYLLAIVAVVVVFASPVANINVLSLLTRSDGTDVLQRWFVFTGGHIVQQLTHIVMDWASDQEWGKWLK